MSIAEFIALMAGGMMEAALLYVSGHDNAQLSDDAAALDPKTTFSYEPMIFAGGIALLGIAVLVSWTTVGSTSYAIVDETFTVAVAILLAAVLFGSVVGNYLLPRINEQQMLIVHVLVGINLLFSDRLGLSDGVLWLLLLPTAALIFQALWPRVLPIFVRALYYFWYLITLVALAFQNRGTLFEAMETTLLEDFIFASILIFLAVHILIAVRFLLIISSLIVPRNRPLLQIIMPHLVNDEQMPRLNVMLIVVIVAMLVGLNLFFELVLDQMLVNALVLGVLHFGKQIRVTEILGAYSVSK